ncbi:MAG: peptide-methionine (R)-S-oxide reductase [Pirellulaceae bacterium]
MRRASGKPEQPGQWQSIEGGKDATWKLQGERNNGKLAAPLSFIEQGGRVNQGEFTSGANFNSGTAKPGLFQPISDEIVLKRTDNSHGAVRTEVLCARRERHLEHRPPAEWC